MPTLPDRHHRRTPSTASRKSGKRHALLALLLALTGSATLAIWPTASDAGDNDHEMARQALRQGQVLPLRTVLDRVEQQYQGQVIKVEFERDDGRFVYEIRLLQSDGKVVKLEIDAGDGSLISMKRKK
ncbi:PepSY domain-containing protein [Comamonas aquatilis]